MELKNIKNCLSYTMVRKNLMLDLLNIKKPRNEKRNKQKERNKHK